MALPVPILDDRSYLQLRDELVRRIPIYTREWTDHNPSDPGITLLELFAFLGENLLYRFNQIPERTKLEFLRLLQIPLSPGAAAKGLVTMTTESAEGVLVEINSEAKAGNLSFEIRDEVHVWPISVLAMAKSTAGGPNPETEAEAHEFALRTVDALQIRPEDAAYYETKLVSADGEAPPVDFAESKTVDAILWVAVLKEKGFSAPAFKTPSDDRGPVINIGFVPDAPAPPMEEIDGCPGAGTLAKKPPVDWQIYTGRVDGEGEPVYRAVALIADTTRGLTQEGIVRLRLPRDVDPRADDRTFEPQDPDLAGTGDFPPLIPDDEKEGNVLFWLRAFRPDGSGFGKVLLVAANAAEVVQSRAAQPEFLGTGTGQPNQRYLLTQRPVIEGSATIEVEEDGEWRKYDVVDSFHASSPDDRHCIVDREAGEVRFGTVVQAYVPQIAQRIRVTSYRYGGGRQGNLPAKAIAKLPAIANVKIQNPLRTHGGEDPEAINDALERIPGEIRRRDRAVTAGDFRELALQTPGADVWRAEVMPRFHPKSKRTDAAGVVSVVVWPKEDHRNPAAPLPDRNLLRAVCAWLDYRRLVTTELYVIPPAYRRIAVSVGLQVKPGYGSEAVRRWVELVLRQYLAPLPPFGPTGGGWPLGRRVHGPELEAAALQVEGVEFLEGLNVSGWNDEIKEWIPGTVMLQSYEVPELTEITVLEGAPLATPEAAIQPPEPPKAPVPVPVLREKC